MKHQLLAIAAAILSLAACTSDDDALSAYRNDPTAVRVNAQVGSTATDGFGTRSNPIGTAEEQKTFKTDDEIRVSVDGQDAVTYRYNGTEWLPQDNKYLKWETNTMTFTAYYPASFNGTVSQPMDYTELADLEKADYMRFNGSQTNADGNKLSLTMERQMARVIVEIAKYNDQYSGNASVKSVTLCGNVKAFKHTDGKFYALMKPNDAENASEEFLKLEVTDGEASTQETLTGIPQLEKGKSYTYSLTVGKNKLQIANVMVADWSTGEIVGGKAQLKYSIDGNVITTREEGLLSADILAQALGTGHDIKIVGPMNDADFTVLYDFLSELGIAESGTPIDLDLSEAQVTTIPSGAFYDYNNDSYTLGNVALPKSVKTIGECAFGICKKLNITNWEQLTSLNRIHHNAFDGCSALTGNVVLSGQSSYVGFSAFAGTQITSISFPDGVKLEETVCSSCEKLEKITFQGNVIFSDVLNQFRRCTALTTIDFSHCTSVPNIDVVSYFDPFKDVTRSSITLKVPAGMTTEFANNGWTDFKISETIELTSAGTLTNNMLNSARNNGTSLKIAGPMNDNDFTTLKNYLEGLYILSSGTPIDLDLSEAQVTTIPSYAFDGYYNGSYTLGNVALPKSVKTIGKNAFFNCKKLNITNWEQLTKLTTIGDDAFYKNSLSGNVVLPNSVAELGSSAFNGTKITSLSLPNGVKLSIATFYQCDKLQTITFRGDVEFSPVNEQFLGCTALTTIDISHCTSVPDISGYDPFKDVTRSNVTLKVPAGKKQEFIENSWTGFNIVEQ